jgi:hypothetical protein
MPGIDLKSNSVDNCTPMTVSLTLTLDWDALVTKHAPSGVKAVDRALLDSAKGLLREFFKVEGIN